MSNPRLLAISGLLKGTVWTLNGDPLLLGRDPANQIVMGEAGVSRRHCSVREVSGVFEIAEGTQIEQILIHLYSGLTPMQYSGRCLFLD